MSLPPYFDDRSKVREVAVWAAATQTQIERWEPQFARRVAADTWKAAPPIPKSDIWQALASVFSVDLPIAASQAEYVLSQSGGHRDRLHTALVPPSVSPDFPEPKLPRSEHVDDLLDILSTENAWLAWMSFVALIGHSVLDVAGELEKRPKGVGHNRRLGAKLMLAHSDDQTQTVRRLVGATDIFHRLVGAEELAGLCAEGATGSLAEEMESVLSNPDLTIRWSFWDGLKDAEVDYVQRTLIQITNSDPENWSCGECGSKNGLGELDCAHCEKGERPEFRKLHDLKPKWQSVAASKLDV